MALDLRRKERCFEQLTLSDSKVVKYLILFRSKIDVSYGAGINIDINQAGDIFEFNQELISLYVSLDDTVEQSSLTKKQINLLKYLYDGNTVKDVSIIFKSDRVSIYQMLDRIIEKIVETNNENWYYTAGHNNYILNG